MKKYRIQITSVREYEVLIDEEKLNSEAKKNFEETLWDLPEADTAPEAFARGLALECASGDRIGSYIEGFGYCNDLKRYQDEEAFIRRIDNDCWINNCEGDELY